MKKTGIKEMWCLFTAATVNANPGLKRPHFSIGSHAQSVEVMYFTYHVQQMFFSLNSRVSIVCVFILLPHAGRVCMDLPVILS